MHGLASPPPASEISMANCAHILIAEDEANDAELLRLAFQNLNGSSDVMIVRDGEEAVNYLSGKAPYEDQQSHPVPDLILLDLKMPRMTGFEVLEWLGKHPELKEVPAVVLSASSIASDIEKARNLGAAD